MYAFRRVNDDENRNLRIVHRRHCEEGGIRIFRILAVYRFLCCTRLAADAVSRQISRFTAAVFYHALHHHADLTGGLFRRYLANYGRFKFFNSIAIVVHQFFHQTRLHHLSIISERTQRRYQLNRSTSDALAVGNSGQPHRTGGLFRLQNGRSLARIIDSGRTGKSVTVQMLIKFIDADSL